MPRFARDDERRDHEEALRRIREVQQSGGDKLDLRGLHHLRALPEELKELTALTKLDLSYCQQLTDFKPVVGLTRLVSLRLISCEELKSFNSLAGLSYLTRLNLSYCRQFNSLTTLSDLTALTSLTLNGCTQLTDLSPLAGLANLNSLSLSGCHQLTDLSPLAGLANLTSLSLSGCHQLTDLSPLAGLTNVRRLELEACMQLTELAPLSRITALTTLALSYSRKLAELKPLAKVLGLRSLSSQHCAIGNLSEAILNLPELEELFLYGNPIECVPMELLGADEWHDCLPGLRAHFADIADGSARDNTIRGLILGNGRVGKTSLMRRLIDDTFDPDEDSTHGIRFWEWETTDTQDRAARYNFWDFGGQDVYLGTHSMFLENCRLAVIVWAPAFESGTFHDEDTGLVHENRPLRYWVEWVRHKAPEATILVVQTRFNDTGQADWQALKELPADAVANVVQFDAADPPYGVDKLKLELQERATTELNRESRELGKGRRKVMARLAAHQQQANRERARREAREAPVAAGETPSQQKLRVAEFTQWCDEPWGEYAEKGVSDPPRFLDLLHRMGLVFYRKGFFDGAIIIDLPWLVDAVYAVFHRKQTMGIIQDLGGRFTRQRLGRYLWDEQRFSAAEQAEFVKYLESAGACFALAKDEADGETWYLVPELLPTREAAFAQARAPSLWRDDVPTLRIRYTFDFLDPGRMRGWLATLGDKFGRYAIYWKWGAYLPNERGDVAIVTIEDLAQPAAHRWPGTLTIEVQGTGRVAYLAALRRELALERNWVMGTEVDHRLPIIHVAHNNAPWVELVQLRGQAKLGNERMAAEDGTAVAVADYAWALATRRNRLAPGADLADDTLAIEDAGDAEAAIPAAVKRDSSRALTRTEGPPAIYVSYAWASDKEDEFGGPGAVTRMIEALRNRGYTVLRDKDLSRYGDDLETMFKEIGHAERLIMIISKAYLRSENCMQEAIFSFERKEQETRILPFVEPSTPIFKIADRRAQYGYWDNEATEQSAFARKGGKTNPQMLDDLKTLERIRDCSVQALAFVVGKNRGDFGELLANDCERLCEIVEEWMQNPDAFDAKPNE